jgi:methionyl-tRNA formyltransferase
MDTGPIYLMKRFAVDDDITSDELFKELAELGADALLEALAAITNGVKPTPQGMNEASKATKITKSEAEITWDHSAISISRKIRAFTSSPGAWTTFRDSLIKVDSPVLEEIILKPGEILFSEKKLYVGTGTTAISLGYLTPQGKSRMSADAWINGARLQAGDYFG